MSVAALPFMACLECPETLAAIHRNGLPTSLEWAFARKVHQYELIRENLLDNQWLGEATMIILSVVSVGLGIAGLGYALYQSHERRKLQDYNRSEAWYLYSKTNNMTGTSQLAFKKYKEAHADSLNPEMIELLSKSSAYGLDLFRETIRLIQLSENEFSHKSIDLWMQSGKISNDDHKSMFTMIVVENKKPYNVFHRLR